MNNPPQHSSAPWPKNIKVENLTFFMTLWNILGWSVSILVGLFYLENLSRKQNHMGTEFLWLRDKCLTSESWQGMMAINCFNPPLQMYKHKIKTIRISIVFDKNHNSIKNNWRVHLFWKVVWVLYMSPIAKKKHLHAIHDFPF